MLQFVECLLYELNGSACEGTVKEKQCQAEERTVRQDDCCEHHANLDGSNDLFLCEWNRFDSDRKPVRCNDGQEAAVRCKYKQEWESCKRVVHARGNEVRQAPQLTDVKSASDCQCAVRTDRFEGERVELTVVPGSSRRELMDCQSIEQQHDREAVEEQADVTAHEYHTEDGETGAVRKECGQQEVAERDDHCQINCCPESLSDCIVHQVVSVHPGVD